MSSSLDYEINKELGECYLFMGEFDKAEAYYEKAIAANDKESTPYLAMAAIAIHRKQLEVAATLYHQAIALGVSDKALAGLGLVNMELGYDEEAYGNFVGALELNPCNGVALNCIVREGYKLGKLEEIVLILENSLKTEEQENVRISLAGCLVSLGRNSEAKAVLEQVLVTSPANVTAMELLEHIAA